MVVSVARNVIVVVVVALEDGVVHVADVEEAEARLQLVKASLESAAAATQTKNLKCLDQINFIFRY